MNAKFFSLEPCITSIIGRIIIAHPAADMAAHRGQYAGFRCFAVATVRNDQQLRDPLPNVLT